MHVGLSAALARRRLRQQEAPKEPIGLNIVEANRTLLKSRGLTDRELDIIGQDEVMRRGNQLRKADGLPQLGRKPAWLS